MTTAQSPTPSLEADRARRAISAAFRVRIVAESDEIRSSRSELRELQRRGSDVAPGLQARLHRLRMAARARLLAYGLHRGMALERMERGRTGLDHLPSSLPGLIRRAAEQAEQEAQA